MLFEPIHEIPSLIRLALFVNEESSKIDFTIIDPNEKVIFSQEEKIHIFHEFNATISGEYKFILSNQRSDESKRITFAIHQGNSTNSHLSHEQLDKLWEKILKVDKQIKS